MSRDATRDTAAKHPPCGEIRIDFSLPRQSSSTWTLVFATTTTACAADTSVVSICGRNVHWWFAANPRRAHTTTCNLATRRTKLLVLSTDVSAHNNTGCKSAVRSVALSFQPRISQVKRPVFLCTSRRLTKITCCSIKSVVVALRSVTHLLSSLTRSRCQCVRCFQQAQCWSPSSCGQTWRC